MPYSLSRRLILRTSGVGLVTAIAGCSVLSTEGSPPTMPIFVENRGNERHTAVVQVHSTVEEETFDKEVEVPPGILAKVGDITSDSFCIRGIGVSFDETFNICPEKGDGEYSQNGYIVTINPASTSDQRDRRIEITKIEDADVQ
ncbi:hypothetical protein [Saliphagus infecundisoli]|uniref:Lipoprotein n=1 Tax=Saliphagus infecundisoli TaxID=1849069 RepID=A0ABD5QHD5_9EURY|nr:hypothetical protein [Saliphagus infecundisoli]